MKPHDKFGLTIMALIWTVIAVMFCVVCLQVGKAGVTLGDRDSCRRESGHVSPPSSNHASPGEAPVGRPVSPTERTWLISPPGAALFSAIRQEESRNGRNLIGDSGASKGPYHIGRAYWTDACEFGGVNWDYDKLVWSRPHCEQVMLWYWARYGATTDEQKARMHNGGPRGHKRTATLGYWQRIRTTYRKGF